MFAALARARRLGRGAVTLRYVPDAPDARPRVAYSVGRGVGGAVQRNRARRRLRAAVLEVSERLVGGAYLFGASSEVVTMPFSELVERVGGLVDAARDAP